MSADRRAQDGAAPAADVADEGPDSLMSRLDGSAPPGEAPTSDRPSAAELLGGRGKRRRGMAIRVPDDATPPPPPAKRSQPPPAMPAPEATSSSLSNPPPGLAPLPVLDPVPTVRITPTRMIAVGAPSAMAPPSLGIARPTGDAPPSTTPSPSPSPSNDVPSIVAAAASTASPSPSQRPSQPPPRPSQPAPRLNTPYPMPSPFAPPPGLPDASAIAAGEVVIKPVPVPAGAMISQPIEPIAPPSTTPAQERPIRAPTVPNLDKAVKDALDLLDREDFESTAIDIAVVPDHADEETQPRLPVVNVEASPTSEESLDDSVVEEVQPQPTSGKMKPAVPAPPPRKVTAPGQQAKAEPSGTLPSARVTEPVSTSGAQPVAAAVEPSAARATANLAPPAATADSTAEIKKKKRQWFEELFNDDFARTMPRVPASHLDREVAFIDESLGCEKGATILDLGCGPGEHAVRLAKRGYEVIGIDLSLAMLARAADEAAALDTHLNFVQGDMRELTFEEQFDGVYCWGTTFGYFEEQKNAEVIGKVHRALRRGGRVLLDVVNRDYVMPRQPSMAWFEGEGCVCMDEMNVNAITSRLHVKRTMMMDDGRQREIDYSIRIYSLHELGKLLHESGFRVVEASGDTSTPGVYFGAESPRILILAEKR